MSSHSTRFVHLAHMRITSPIAYIHLLFGPLEVHRTWTEDGLGIFCTESDIDRLNVGPFRTPEGMTVFGITRSGVENKDRPSTQKGFVRPSTLDAIRLVEMASSSRSWGAEVCTDDPGDA